MNSDVENEVGRGSSAWKANMIGVTIFGAFCIGGIVFLIRFFVALCDKREPERCGYVVYAPRKSSKPERIARPKGMPWQDETGRAWSLLSTRSQSRLQQRPVRAQRGSGR